MTFMISKFEKLPNDIQSKIMLATDGFQQPKPLFKKGSIVQYIKAKRILFKEQREQMRLVYPSAKFGNLPIYNLLISENPEWNPTSKTYSYQYDYGHCLTSEGFAQEKDLVEASSMSISMNIF